MSGDKVAEVRRRFPSSLVGTEIFIYSSSPDQVILGRATIAAVAVSPAEALLEDATRLMISADELRRYLSGVSQAAVISLADRRPFRNPVSLRLISDSGVKAPQSYRYLNHVTSTRIRQIGEA